MSTDKHDALSKGNDYKEKSRKESDRLRKTMDQQIPNTTNQTTQDLPTVRTLSVEILQKMTESPLEQEVSRRVYDTKNCDCREENVIPLEGKLKPDSQEYELKPRGRQLKWGKSQQKKEGSLSNKKETPISDSKQSSVRDLSNRKRQGQKSYIGNSRIPKLTSCSVEPGLNKMCPASAKNMKDIQNNVNKKTPSLAGRLNATRDVAPSMTKAKQKAENVLPAKDQSDFGKKIVSETLSGKYESTEVDRMMQNEVYNSLSKTDRNFCQRTIQKLVLNSPMSLELSYVVTLSPEKTVRTSLTAFQVQEPHLANDSVLTTFPAGLESCQTTKGRTSSSGPKDRWSVAVFPRGSSLSNKTPKKENQESHNLENTRLASPFSTSKFLRDSSTMLRSSLRRKDNLISYREPRLNW
ncbi:uncharacterized protein LOC141491715 [Macrotis lagotis]|uniref:uncharacterized protein LOC141491715 n=1 Tax=Macrotis lagotis TaxID=92651 RepID=UPI003D6836A9